MTGNETGLDQPVEEFDSFWNGPATDDNLFHNHQMDLGHFDGFVSATAMADLKQSGITVLGRDLTMLWAALRTFSGMPYLRATPDEIAREKRIQALSSELSHLLEPDLAVDGGWRSFWGDADWSDFEETLKQPDPEDTVDVKELLDNLDVLHKTATERLFDLDYASKSSLQPGNSARRDRYFYWHILIAFWHHQMGRDIGTCTAPGREPYGPLISFIRAMSSGKLSDEQLTGQTIRAFILRAKKETAKLAEFAQYFDGRSNGR